MLPISGGQGNLMDELMMAKAPESVSDMRSKGENRQFMDEVAYYLEGLGGTSAMRRTRYAEKPHQPADISALDILGSMQRDQEWLMKMNVCGQTEPVFEALAATRSDDEIMDTTCLLFLYIVQNAGISMEQVLVEHPTAVLQIIGKGLGMSSGPLDKTYPAKVTATVSSSCREAHQADKQITKLRLMGRNVETLYEYEGPPTRYVAASVLSHILQNPDRWPSLQSAFEEEAVGVKLLKALDTEVSPLRSRVELYSKGFVSYGASCSTNSQDLLPKDQSVDLPTIEHCLTALSHRFVMASIGEDNLRLQPLYDALVVMAVALTDEDAELRETGQLHPNLRR